MRERVFMNDACSRSFAFPHLRIRHLRMYISPATSLPQLYVFLPLFPVLKKGKEKGFTTMALHLGTISRLHCYPLGVRSFCAETLKKRNPDLQHTRALTCTQTTHQRHTKTHRHTHTQKHTQGVLFGKSKNPHNCNQRWTCFKRLTHAPTPQRLGLQFHQRKTRPQHALPELFKARRLTPPPSDVSCWVWAHKKLPSVDLKSTHLSNQEN